MPPVNAPVQVARDTTTRFTYRVDRSVNNDHPFIVTASRSVGYFGGARLAVEQHIGNRTGHFVDVDRREAIALRDILNAALDEWKE